MASLNLHHLRLFRATAREGTLTAAARALNISQSAVSTQIKALEADLGHDLFERRGRNLVLTEAGRIALDYAEQIFRASEQLSATFRAAGGQRKVLRIGALATLTQVHEHPACDGVALHALRQAAGEAASPQIRNRATVGGNLLQKARCWYLRTPGNACIKLGGETCAAAADLGESRYNGIFASNGCHSAHPSNLAPALIALKGSARCVHPDGDRAMDVELIIPGPWRVGNLVA